ncbi:NB-ARC domain-containing protein [Streptomyces sp. NPDC005794]|uniref:NB-ARC domain-containing protein n=1 Tax=Streptomyces sp. NPDC005794 TaxID=3364733 RepID=UPI0036A35E8A
MRAREVAGGALGVALGAAVPLAASLAGNAATEAERWPGWLDVLRRHPWVSLAVVLMLTGALLAVERRRAADSTGRRSSAVPPSAVPQPPRWMVEREETERVVDAVLAEHSGTVGLTTGLQGAGGFGKTTLAKAVCADERVRRRFPDILFVTLGGDLRGGPRIAGKATEVIQLVTGKEALFHEDPAMAGAQLGRVLDEWDRPLLLVLDDVWSEAQLAPFLIGGRRCVRLVTTRIPSVLPDHTPRVLVDRMTDEQARTVLTTDLDLSGDQTAALLTATGGWPLLLRLVNRRLAAERATGLSTADSVAETLALLRSAGPAGADLGNGPEAVDLDDPAQRERAVRATVEASARLLDETAGERERLLELGAFAEDEVIPVELVCALWRETAGYEPVRSRALCRRLRDVALIGLNDSGGLLLHDVVRDYLRAELGPDRLSTAHAHLIAGARPSPPPTAWWDLPEGYLHDHLVHHLVEAGLVAEADRLVGDLRWVEQRIRHRNQSAPFNDARLVPTASAARRASDISATVHLMDPEDSWALRAATLYSRLGGQPHWADRAAERAARLPGPALVNHLPPPDLPDSSVLRVLPATGTVMGVGLAPDGSTVTTVDGDHVRQWDVESGRVLWERPFAHEFSVRDGYRQIGSNYAISADGRWFVHVRVHGDGVATVWEVGTGNERTAECPFDFLVGVAVSPDGRWVAFCSVDEVAVCRAEEPNGHRRPEETPRRAPRPAGWLHCLAISSEGAVAVVHAGAVLLLHDWRDSDEEGGAPTTLGTGDVLNVDAAGDFLVYGAEDEARLRDLLTGEERSYPCDRRSSRFVVSADGSAVFACLNSPSRKWRQLRREGEPALPPEQHGGEGSTPYVVVNGRGRMVRNVRSGVSVSDPAAEPGEAAPDALRRVHVVPLASGATLVAWFPWRCDRWVPRAPAPGQAADFGVAAPRRGNDLPPHWQRWVAQVSLVRPDPEASLPLKRGPSQMGSVSWTPDGSLVALQNDDSVELWEVATSTRLLSTRIDSSVSDGALLAVAPDGSWVSSAWRPHTSTPPWQRSSCTAVRIWYRDGGTLTFGAPHRPGLEDFARCAAAHPDGDSLLVGWSNAVVLHGLPTDTVLASLPLTDPVDLAISPDGTWFCVVTSQGLVEIRSLPALTLLTRLRTPSPFTACSLSETPDGFLVHADSDRGVHTYRFRPGSGA